MDYEKAILDYLERTRELTLALNVASVDRFIGMLEEARMRGAFIYIMGNGGSAATASHFVNDFNKGVSEGIQPRYKLVSLNDNVSTMLAVANDISYDEIFRFQLENFVTSNDLVIGISGSGNSKNVVNAFELARSKGAKTIALVGFDGGKLLKMADHSVHIPIDNMQHVEDFHMILDHLAMFILKQGRKGTN
uniref:GmhA n=1 Tax=Spirochaeta aurantia TaxID=147 RepID=Q0PHZ4_SPIAU|nr:GmhA [Spirochaeta aurantia]